MEREAINGRNAKDQQGPPRSHQLPDNIVAPIFETAPRLLVELKDKFHLEPKLAELLLPHVLPVIDGKTLEEFMRKRHSELNHGFPPTQFMEGSTMWLQHLAKLSVDTLPGNVREAIPNFESVVPEELSRSYMISGTTHPLAAELKSLIRFTWRRVPQLLDCKDSNDPLNVPYYLYWVTIQRGRSSIFGLPQVCEYIVFRILFAALKGPVSCTAMTQTVSHILYLCQLGSLSACAQLAGPNFLERQLQIARQVQASQVVQYANPLLEKLQEHQNLQLMKEGTIAVTL